MGSTLFTDGGLTILTRGPSNVGDGGYDAAFLPVGGQSRSVAIGDLSASTCTLTAGSCSVTYTPAKSGKSTIEAATRATATT
jgi:hypothetical protein